MDHEEKQKLARHLAELIESLPIESQYSVVQGLVTAPRGDVHESARDVANIGLRLLEGRPPNARDIGRGVSALVTLGSWLFYQPSPAEIRRSARLGKASGMAGWLASHLAGRGL